MPPAASGGSRDTSRHAGGLHEPARLEVEHRELFRAWLGRLGPAARSVVSLEGLSRGGPSPSASTAALAAGPAGGGRPAGPRGRGRSQRACSCRGPGASDGLAWSAPTGSAASPTASSAGCGLRLDQPARNLASAAWQRAGGNVRGRGTPLPASPGAACSAGSGVGISLIARLRPGRTADRPDGGSGCAEGGRERIRRKGLRLGDRLLGAICVRGRAILRREARSRSWLRPRLRSPAGPRGHRSGHGRDFAIGSRPISPARFAQQRVDVVTRRIGRRQRFVLLLTGCVVAGIGPSAASLSGSACARRRTGSRVRRHRSECGLRHMGGELARSGAAGGPLDRRCALAWRACGRGCRSSQCGKEVQRRGIRPFWSVRFNLAGGTMRHSP